MEEKYVPSPEEITKAEEMMTPGERMASEKRERELRYEKLPVLLLYRDNDLFEQKTPELLETLKSFGRTVEVQRFPRETDPKIIGEWSAQHAKEMQDKIVVSDNTCGQARSSINKQILKEVENQTGKEPGAEISNKIGDLLKEQHKFGYLDQLYNQPLEIILRNKSGEKLEFSQFGMRQREWQIDLTMEETGQIFSEIIKQILKNPENKPEKVGIFITHLYDHSPFNTLFWERRDKEPGNAGKKEYEKTLSLDSEKALLNEITEIIKNWLIDAGISQDIIETAGVPGPFFSQASSEQKEKMREEFIKFDKKGYWLFRDRHINLSSADNKAMSLKQGLELQLPLENLFNGVKDKGLIGGLDKTEIENAIQKSLIINFKPAEAGPSKTPIDSQ